MFWEKTYSNNGTSGSGSYGAYALYKAAVLNKFVVENNIRHVTELGCGDGNQLGMFHFPFYTGVDVSETVIYKCRSLFKEDSTKNFYTAAEFELIKDKQSIQTDLALSLDVIYHLLEDDVYEKYIKDLFAASTSFVIIYAWDIVTEKSFHILHRKFSAWINANIHNWQLVSTLKNKELPEACDFFIYKKTD